MLFVIFWSSTAYVFPFLANRTKGRTYGTSWRPSVCRHHRL